MFMIDAYTLDRCFYLMIDVLYLLSAEYSVVMCGAWPGIINQTENPLRWGRVGESERESAYGKTEVVLPHIGHQMLNFILI